jgi:hypothetical protein
LPLQLVHVQHLSKELPRQLLDGASRESLLQRPRSHSLDVAIVQVPWRRTSAIPELINHLGRRRQAGTPVDIPDAFENGVVVESVSNKPRAPNPAGELANDAITPARFCIDCSQDGANGVGCVASFHQAYSLSRRRRSQGDDTVSQLMAAWPPRVNGGRGTWRIIAKEEESVWPEPGIWKSQG